MNYVSENSFVERTDEISKTKTLSKKSLDQLKWACNNEAVDLHVIEPAYLTGIFIEFSSYYPA